MPPISYARHQFPPEVIRQAVWLYLRFTLSYRDVEDLLAERGLAVSYETVRRWVLKFGPAIARRLRQRRPKPSPRWHLDEMVILSAKSAGRLAAAILAGNRVGLHHSESDGVGTIFPSHSTTAHMPRPLLAPS